MEKFLGRTYNPNTDTYECTDGSGVVIPSEVKKEILFLARDGDGGTIVALDYKWKYEEKMRREKLDIINNK